MGKNDKSQVSFFQAPFIHPLVFGTPGWYPSVPPTYQSSHHWLQTLHRAHAAVQIGAPKHPKHHRRWGQNLQVWPFGGYQDGTIGWHQGGPIQMFSFVCCLFAGLLAWLLAFLFVCLFVWLVVWLFGWLFVCLSVCLYSQKLSSGNWSKDGSVKQRGVLIAINHHLPL